VKKRMVQLNVRVPKKFKDLMIKYVEVGTHKDLSEFTRDAVREKIKRDAPNFFAEMIEKESKE